MKVVQTTFLNAQALAIIVDRALGYPKSPQGWDGTGINQGAWIDSVWPEYAGTSRQHEWIWYLSAADAWYPLSDATVTSVNASSLVSAGDKATINAAVRVDIGSDPKTGGRVPRAHFIGPTVYWLGDSIVQASVTADEPNGGFRGLLKAYCVARGYRVDHVGIFSIGALRDNETSGVGGNTCSDMNTRVPGELVTGTGVLGCDFVKLAIVMAGSNDVRSGSSSTANYSTLLTTLHNSLVANQPTARICVTTIPPMNDFSVTTFNAGLPAVWNAFDSAHPSNTLIRWDAFNALGGAYSSSYFYDNVHPNHAGYVQMVNHATYGLAQALDSYLATIGAWP